MIQQHLSSFDQVISNFWDSKEEFFSAPCEVFPETSIQMVHEYNYKNQRPIRKQKVALYAETMREGHWRDYSPIEFAVLDGVPQLINGQHTLSAVHAARKSLKVNLSLVRVKSQLEIDDRYARHDVSEMRIFSDVAGDIGEQMGLQKSHRDSLAVAVKQISLGFKDASGKDTAARLRLAKDLTARKELMLEWKEEAQIYFSMLRAETTSTFSKELFKRGAVVGVALITLRHQRAKALEFWSAAMSDDCLRTFDPRKTLSSWLKANPVAHKKDQQARACACCWNSYLQKEDLKRVYPDTAPASFIQGTGFQIRN